MPYTEALFRSIPKLTDDSHARLEIIGGQPPRMTELGRGCKFAPRCKYAQELCVAEEPALLEGPPPAVSSDSPASAADAPDAVSEAPARHVYRCFFPVGSDEAAEALARNIASGRVSETGVVIQPA